MACHFSTTEQVSSFSTVPLNKEAVPPSVLGCVVGTCLDLLWLYSLNRASANHHSRPRFEWEGQLVLVCNFHRKPHWVSATIIKAVGSVYSRLDAGSVQPVLPWNVLPYTIRLNADHTVDRKQEAGLSMETSPSINAISHQGSVIHLTDLTLTPEFWG